MSIFEIPSFLYNPNICKLSKTVLDWKFIKCRLYRLHPKIFLKRKRKYKLSVKWKLKFDGKLTESIGNCKQSIHLMRTLNKQKNKLKLPAGMVWFVDRICKLPIVCFSQIFREKNIEYLDKYYDLLVHIVYIIVIISRIENGSCIVMFWTESFLY